MDRGSEFLSLCANEIVATLGNRVFQYPESATSLRTVFPQTRHLFLVKNSPEFDFFMFYDCFSPLAKIRFDVFDEQFVSFILADLVLSVYEVAYRPVVKIFFQELFNTRAPHFFVVLHYE